MRDKQYIMEKFVKAPNGYNYVYTPILEELARVRSEYQEILVARTPFGRTLILDGIIQLTEYDEKLYHEALVKPGYKKSYRKILILGGGDGGAAREAINISPSIEVTIVDIDPLVTKIVSKYIPEVPAGVFNKPNVKLVNTDAWKYVEETDERYGYILVDLTDVREEENQVNRFYRSVFMEKLKRLIPDEGRIVYFLGLYPIDKDIISRFLVEADKIFRYRRIYGRYIPSFGGIWTYIVLSNKPIRLNRLDGLIYIDSIDQDLKKGS